MRAAAVKAKRDVPQPVRMANATLVFVASSDNTMVISFAPPSTRKTDPSRTGESLRAAGSSAAIKACAAFTLYHSINQASKKLVVIFWLRSSARLERKKTVMLWVDAGSKTGGLNGVKAACAFRCSRLRRES